MQALLAERFKLALHKESSQMPVYELVVDKGGFKGKESAADAKGGWQTSRAAGRNDTLMWPNVTMSALAAYLYGNHHVNRRVVDKTGLTGIYDIALTYAPPYRLTAAMPNEDDVTIFTALRTQLGVRLERAMGTVDVWVVDHWEKPADN